MIGHQEILEYLQNCSSKQTLVHAYSLIGPSGSGRKKLLEVFLGGWLKTKSLDHPDIRLVAPENDTITIEQIRDLKQWLGLSPLAGANKAAIIKAAEKMNDASQNAFLKVLEEPVPNTYIFLLVSHRRALLPTVYSRTVPLYFTAPSNRPVEIVLLKELLAAKDPSERLRAWLKQGIAKEDARDWLYKIVPELRQLLLQTRSPQHTKIIKSLLESLAGSSGQNWQLIAENLILSI